jgi:hypothetical protein
VVCRRQYWRNWINAKRAEQGDTYRTKVRMSVAKNPVGSMLRGVKSRATRRGIAFSITRDDIAIPDACPCCSRTLERRNGEFAKGATDASPSLDRIIPSLGYVPGNVAVICYRCNELKRNASLDELRSIVRWLESMQPAKPLKLVGGSGG